jgi:hypothetical protein
MFVKQQFYSMILCHQIQLPSDTAINIAADISLKLNCPVFFEWQAKSEDGYIDTQIRVESMGLQKQND